MSSSLFVGAAFPVIKDEPYSASVREQEIRAAPNGERSVHEAFNVHMRDSAGRVRDEQLASPPDSQGGFTQAGFQVIDPVEMRDYRWESDSKTVRSAVIPATYNDHRQSPIHICAQATAASQAYGLPREPSESQEIDEDLGFRIIEGVTAHGCRITRTLPARGVASDSAVLDFEFWDSPELQINLLTTEHDSDGTERLTRLSNIHRNEPAPTLFRVPEGYTDPASAQGDPMGAELGANPLE